jgi:hypothetical protein
LPRVLGVLLVLMGTGFAVNIASSQSRPARRLRMDTDEGTDMGGS